MLRPHFDEAFGLPLALVPYAILSTEALALRAPGAPLNTLDLPVLEFEMTRLRESASIEAFRDRVFGGIDREALRRGLAGPFAWRAEDFERFLRLRLEQLRNPRGEVLPAAGPVPLPGPAAALQP
jgi:hypothetical protein